MDSAVHSQEPREEAMTPTQLDIDLFVDSLDVFIGSLIWEEPQTKPRKPPVGVEAS